MAKRTWDQMDMQATAQVKKFVYGVDLITPNGSLFGYEEIATSPSEAYHIRLCKRYDPKQYGWFVKELKHQSGANVIVTKKSGIRKTKHYYYIEVVPKAVYDERMAAYNRQANNQQRYSSY